MACYGLTAGAQVRQSTNFIYLFSDSVIYAESVRLRPDFYHSFQIRADSKRFPVAQVKFFSNEDGFFANARKLNFTGSASFSERIITGKINLYQEAIYVPYLYDRQYKQGYSAGLISDVGVNAAMFYNKGYGDLKKVNYNNLRLDMADDPESMRLLTTYRKSIKTRNTLYTAAGISVVGTIVTFLAAANAGIDQMGSKMTVSFGFLGAAFGFATGGYFVHATGNRHLENAVDHYNR